MWQEIGSAIGSYFGGSGSSGSSGGSGSSMSASNSGSQPIATLLPNNIQIGGIGAFYGSGSASASAAQIPASTSTVPVTVPGTTSGILSGISPTALLLGILTIGGGLLLLRRK